MECKQNAAGTPPEREGNAKGTPKERQISG